MKVLEAMQLILSVPGAPILAFLAIDSRVVVASVEQTFGAVLMDAHISGWEYLGTACESNPRFVASWH